MRKVKVKTEYGEEVRYYLTEEEAVKYRRLGFNVKQGPRGGWYITEEDFIAGKKRIRERREGRKFIEDKNRDVIDELLDELEELLKKKDYKGAYKIIEKLKSMYYDDLRENEKKYLEIIEEKVVRLGSDDILKIGLKKEVFDTDKKIYERVVNKLKVFNAFGGIKRIRHIEGNTYRIVCNGFEFEVKYDSKGNVEKFNLIVGDRKLNERESAVYLFRKTKGKVINDVFKAFSSVYGSRKEGSKIVIEINRRNKLVDKIEVVRSSGRKGGKIAWIMFIFVKAKEMGLAVKILDDVFRLLSSEAFVMLLKEMMSITG